MKDIVKQSICPKTEVLSLRKPSYLPAVFSSTLRCVVLDAAGSAGGITPKGVQ